MSSFFKFKIRVTAFFFLGMISTSLVAQTILLPNEAKFKIGDDMAWANQSFNDATWETKQLAARWDPPVPDKLVYAWYRIKITIPSSFKKIAVKGNGLKLILGKIDDTDQTFFNGKLVGETGSFPPDYVAQWEKGRAYNVPLDAVKWDEENVIAVRMCSILGGAGMYEGPYSVSAIQWSDFITVEKSFLETADKGFITKLKFINNGNSSLNGVVNYWIKDRKNNIVFSETKPVIIHSEKNAVTEFLTSNYIPTTENIFTVRYEIVENESMAALQYDQIYLADKNIEIPVLKEVKPVVQDKIKNNFSAVPFQNQKFNGYLGTWFTHNLEQNILKIDEGGMMNSYLHRPGNQYWVGEHAGKYLETACNIWKLTKNPALKKQMDRMMYELIHTQKEDGYLGTYTPDQYWTSWDVWSHKYNLHGLLAYYSVTGYKPALEACIKMGDLLCKTFGKKEGQRDITLAGTHGGMASTSVLDGMVELYKYTADKKYLDFCYYILDSWEQENGAHIISTILKTGRVKDVGNGKAYEMLSNYVGVIKLYQITGDARFLKAVEMAWKDIVDKRLYITGSTSSREHFQEDNVLPAGSDNNVGEGCVTATWIQLNQNLFAITGDIKYLNQLEKTVYNHLLASENPQNGYISDYTPLMGKKPYSCCISCCKSSVPRAIALIPNFTFGAIKNVPTVLFYEPAVYKENITTSNNKNIDATFKIEGNFPESGKLTITVVTSQSADFSLALRIPVWCSNFVAKVGNAIYRGIPNKFVTIKKNWKSGEKISVSFDMPFQQISGGKSYPNQIAFQRGPQVLAADKSLNSERVFTLISNSKENIVVGEPNFTNESKNLPENWIGNQGYSFDILNEKVFLVPFAEASQNNGDIRVWLPLTTSKDEVINKKQYFIQESKTSQGSVYYVSHSENMPKVKEAKLIFSSTSSDILQQIKPKFGDQILFQSGDFFHGSLNIEAQGKVDAPIKIGRFGKGNRPVIDGNGAKGVISLLNPAYLVIENLEIMNEKGDYGILIEAKNSGELKNITIQDCEIHSVFLASKKKEVATNDGNKYNGGIKVIIYKGEQPSWWNGFVVQRNYIHNLGLCGFSIRSEYLLHKNARGNEAPYPSFNVLMENNIIKNIIRDGVIMAEVDGAIMQYNEVCRTGQMGLANGIWYWDAQNSVIQRNIGYECHSFQNDGGPFSIDYYSTNCTIQYNYSYNNDGPGMMAFGNHESGKGNLIKGNISYNDNRMNQDDGFAAITILSAATEVIVEDNTVIAGTGTNYLLDHLDWEGKPLDVLYRNNKFYGNNNAKFGRFLKTGAKFEGNIFTNVPNLPENIKEEKGYKIFNKAYADNLAARLHAGVRESGFMLK